MVVIAAWTLVAIFAPLLEPYDPLAQDFPLFANHPRSTGSAPTSSAATCSPG